MVLTYKTSLRGELNPHWRGGDATKYCLYCGSSYLVPARFAPKSKYCSRKCQGASRRNPNKEVRVKRERKSYSCTTCGKSILKGRKYCSDCFIREKRSSWQSRECLTCKKSFKYLDYRVDAQYCSVECYVKWGASNPNWRGGIKPLTAMIRGCSQNKILIKSVLKRDKSTCQLCSQVGGRLEVDHINKFANIVAIFLKEYETLDIQRDKYELFSLALKYPSFWDKTNLRTLCRKCNWQRQVEGNRKEIG